MDIDKLDLTDRSAVEEYIVANGHGRKTSAGVLIYGDSPIQYTAGIGFQRTHWKR